MNKVQQMNINLFVYFKIALEAHSHKALNTEWLEIRLREKLHAEF